MLEKEMDKYSEMGFSDMGVFWGVLAHGSESVHPSRLTRQRAPSRLARTCTLQTGQSVRPQTDQSGCPSIRLDLDLPERPCSV